ncbi:MAG TPA: hypothetical protein VF981_12325 [Gemmatimonadaceae bacterium]
MSRLAVICVALLLAACSLADGPVEPAASDFSAIVGRQSRTFVLTGAENQRSEWIVTFDHQCEGVHFQTRLKEQFVFSPDGGARAEAWIEVLRDGELDGSTHLTFSGLWAQRSTNRVVLTLHNDDLLDTGGGFERPVRLVGSATLRSTGAMGGACLGSPDDSRAADFIYTLR